MLQDQSNRCNRISMHGIDYEEEKYNNCVENQSNQIRTVEECI